MTSKKTTKRALLTSVIALLLCCSMLVGTTYAWFTDEVESGNNVITAGNLDVEVTQDGQDIRERKLFEDILWEPGVVAYENITVENKGTLALKYDLLVNFSNENYVTDAEGDQHKLSQVLQVAIVPGGVTGDDRAALTGSIADWALLKELKKEGELYPEGNADQYAFKETFGIVIWWEPSDADNNWNVHNGKVVSDYVANDPEKTNQLRIDLGVHVYAQQLTYEEDSFGSDYDEMPWDGTADFAVFCSDLPEDPTEEDLKKVTLDEDEYIITTAGELAAFAKLVDAGQTFKGKTVKLSKDIDLNYVLFDPIGSYRFEKSFMGTFDGQGHTISKLSQNTWGLDNGYYYNDCGLGLFGAVEDGTVKDLVIDGAEISGESAICGTVAAVAHNATFENVTVKNANVADYQYYAGGIVGWASGEMTFTGCNVDASTNVAAQWGDFDNSIGGVIGGASTSAKILMKDCTVACRIDAYNDVTSTYQWYAYRRCGMLIGNSGATEVNGEGTTVAAAPQLTCENVTVIYDDWANYTYCEFAGTSWPYVRVQAGVSNSAYSNPRYGHPTDANGNEVVDDTHAHNDGEDHFIECTFDQLYGGGQGVYGNPAHEGVTVVYNNK